MEELEEGSRQNRGEVEGAGRRRREREKLRSETLKGWWGEVGRMAEGGRGMDDSNVESRSRIVGRDRYYWQEEKGPERGDEREKETTGRKREEEKAVPTLRAF